MSPEALAALHAACFTHPRPWSAAEFEALLPGPGIILLTEGEPGVSATGEADGMTFGTCRGFLLGRVVADEAEVLTLAVDPAARRQGTGERLVAAFLAEAAARGAMRVFLEVAVDNRAALGLYRKAGFTDSGRRRGYAATGVDALVLARDLTGI